jgi:hypothetical protein
VLENRKSRCNFKRTVRAEGKNCRNAHCTLWNWLVMVLQIELFQPHTVPSGLTHKCINVLSLSPVHFPDNAILFRVRQQPAIQLALLAGLPRRRQEWIYRIRWKSIVCCRGGERNSWNHRAQTQGNVKLLLLRMAACRCNNFYSKCVATKSRRRSFRAPLRALMRVVLQCNEQWQ